MKKYPASLADEMPNDSRQPKWKKQRKERGFDSTEIWNLDATFAKLMLPRIKAFLEVTHHDFDGDRMKKLVEGLELLASDSAFDWDKDIQNKIDEALVIFHEEIRGMWT